MKSIRPSEHQSTLNSNQMILFVLTGKLYLTGAMVGFLVSILKLNEKFIKIFILQKIKKKTKNFHTIFSFMAIFFLVL